MFHHSQPPTIKDTKRRKEKQRHKKKEGKRFQKEERGVRLGDLRPLNGKSETAADQTKGGRRTEERKGGNSGVRRRNDPRVLLTKKSDAIS